jgi:hypothetical protein
MIVRPIADAYRAATPYIIVRDAARAIVLQSNIWCN